MPVLHWHGDVITTPPGLAPLASTSACANQAFARERNVLGLQFHLEADRSAINAPNRCSPNGCPRFPSREVVDNRRICATATSVAVFLPSNRSTITTRLDEEQDPQDGAPAWRGASPEGERSDALALRAARTPTRSLIGSRSFCLNELIDQLMAGAKTGEEITGQGGLLSQLTKRMVERAMEVELTDHLGYEPHQEPPGGAGNTRNGSTPKTLITDQGEVRIRHPA